jgi:RHS repeat-associated protein
MCVPVATATVPSRFPTHRPTPATLLLLVAFVMLGSGLVSARPAHAQAPPPICTSGCKLPPIITITPFSGSITVPRLGVTVDWCDSIPISSHTIKLNGTDVTAQFTYTSGTSHGGCHVHTVSSDTIVLGSGTDSLLATAFSSNNGNLGFDTTIAVYSVAPVSVSVTAQTPLLTLPTSTNATAVFTVTNTGGTSETAALTTSCPSPVTSCSLSAPGPMVLAVGVSQTDTMHLTTSSSAGTGAVKLTATVAGTPSGATGAAETDVTVTALVGHGVQLTAVNPGTLRDPGYCLEVGLRRGVAVSCGDLRYVHALPAVRTYERGHAPVLIYQSQTAHPFLIVPALVTADTSHGTIDSVVVQLKSGGVTLDRARIIGSPSPFAHGVAQRVVLGVDEDSTPTGTIAYFVTASTYAGASHTSDSASGLGAVQSAHCAHAGCGWTVGGLEQLTFYGAGASGSLLWTAGGGDVRYYQPAATRWVWRTDTLDRRDSIRFDSTNSIYLRNAPHGAQVVFDNLGRQVQTIDRLGRITTFAYTTPTSFDVLKITIPTATADTAFDYRFYYNASTKYLDSVTAPGPRGVRRRVALEHDASGQVHQIVDPDGTTDSLLYSATVSALLTTIRDKRGTWTTVAYDSALKVRTVVVDTAGSTPLRISRTFIAQQSKGFHAALVPDSAFTTLIGPRADTTRLWLDRFGGPLRTRDALGHLTIVVRANAQYPGLVTRAKFANGQVLAATYDGRGNVASATDSSTFQGGQYATTSYLADQKWDFDTLTTLALGEFVHSHLDPNTGNRLWQQDGRGAVGQVTFTYDAAHMLSKVTDARGGVDTILYDPVRYDVTSTRTPLFIYTSFYTDSIGRDTLVLTPIDLGQNYVSSVHTTYDAMGRDSIVVTRAPAIGTGTAPESVTVTTRYNAEGQADSVVRWAAPDPGLIGKLTSRWHYDPAGRVISRLPTDAMADSLILDAAGNAIVLLTRRGNVDSMSYDLLNRVVQRTTAAVTYNDYASPAWFLNVGNGYPEDSTHFPYYPTDMSGGTRHYTIARDLAVFAYDAVGYTVQADNNDAQVRRAYNQNGTLATDTLRIRTIARVDSGGDFTTHQYVTGYLYDREKRRTELLAPANVAYRVPAGHVYNAVTYAYDAKTGALTSVVDPVGHTTTYYDGPSNNLDSLNLPGQLHEVYHYDAEDKLVLDSVITRAPTHASPSVYHFESVLRAAGLSYDARSKVVFATNTHTYKDTVTSAYTPLGQVNTTVLRGGFTGPDQVQHLYSFAEASNVDALGNKMNDTAKIAPTDSYQGINNNIFSFLFENGSAFSSLMGGTRSQDTTTYVATTGRVAAFKNTAAVSGGPNPTARTLYTYDASGNVTKTEPDLNAGDNVRLVTLMYYGADEKLRVSDARNVAENVGSETAETIAIAFEEYRYDALGRRVWSRARKWCKGEIGDCYAANTRRTVFDGDQELLEITAPGDSIHYIDSASSSFLTRTGNTTDWEADTAHYVHLAESGTVQLPGKAAGGHGVSINEFYGRVLYIQGRDAEHPLEIIRLNFTTEDVTHVAPHCYQMLDTLVFVPAYSWRGAADNGSMGDGTAATAQTCFSGFFIDPPWTNVFHLWAHTPFAYGWYGSHAQFGLDASGLLNRRNRYYESRTGRFTQEDPIGLAGGVNAYAFAGGDPVSYDDPFGLCPVTAQDPRPCTPMEQVAMNLGNMAPAINHAVAGFALVGAAGGAVGGGVAIAGGGAAASAGFIRLAGSGAGRSLLPAVPHAIAGLERLAKQFGVSGTQIANQALRFGTRMIDNLEENAGNINNIIPRLDGRAGFIRVTTDPTASRIISAGLQRAAEVPNGIESGRFTPIP